MILATARRNGFDPDVYQFGGSVAVWKSEQEKLRNRSIVEPLTALPRLVCGLDCAFTSDGRRIRAAAVVYDRLDGLVVEQTAVETDCHAPYVPTYLSFREVPALLQVLDGLKSSFAAVLLDGQGLAHPRRCGLATHLGVLIDRPTVGCAKSRLIGRYLEPALNAGSQSELVDDKKTADNSDTPAETIGVVLRTRDGVRPLFVSVGHRVDLPTAVALTLACCRGRRLPEPTRLADKLSKFKPV